MIIITIKPLFHLVSDIFFSYLVIKSTKYFLNINFGDFGDICDLEDIGDINIFEDFGDIEDINNNLNIIIRNKIIKNIYAIVYTIYSITIILDITSYIYNNILIKYE